ncbi:hypothetical protein K474DRAFT_375473 [Panus rudis PR-1116 ss-1]|nr:hypothetical protein K474DRAFT_375473 [Panus rudis PR-1116 ss-1]
MRVLSSVFTLALVSTSYSTAFAVPLQWDSTEVGDAPLHGQFLEVREILGEPKPELVMRHHPLEAQDTLASQHEVAASPGQHALHARRLFRELDARAVESLVHVFKRAQDMGSASGQAQPLVHDYAPFSPHRPPDELPPLDSGMNLKGFDDVYDPSMSPLSFSPKTVLDSHSSPPQPIPEIKVTTPTPPAKNIPLTLQSANVHPATDRSISRLTGSQQTIYPSSLLTPPTLPNKASRSSSQSRVALSKSSLPPHNSLLLSP